MPTPQQQNQARVEEAIAQGKIPASERQATLDFINGSPQRAEWFSQQLAGGSYFTKRAMQEAEERRQRQAEIERERQAVQSQREQLEVWSRDARAELDRARQIELEHQRLLAENAALRQATKDFNIDDQVVMPSAPRPATPIPGTTIQPDFNGRLRDTQTGKFISQEEGTRAFQTLIGMTSKAMSVQAEHQRLFGEPLQDSLIEDTIAAGLDDPRAYWEAKYNVQAKRVELAEQAELAKVARIREEERSRLLSEMAVDPTKFAGGGPGAYVPGTSPLADSYMHSRAAAMNPVNEAGQPISDLSPEKRPHLITSQQRISAASERFAKHFNPDGTPRAGMKPPASYVQSMYEQDNT